MGNFFFLKSKIAKIAKRRGRAGALWTLGNGVRVWWWLVGVVWWWGRETEGEEGDGDGNGDGNGDGERNT